MPKYGTICKVFHNNYLFLAHSGPDNGMKRGYKRVYEKGI